MGNDHVHSEKLSEHDVHKTRTQTLLYVNKIGPSTTCGEVAGGWHRRDLRHDEGWSSAASSTCVMVNE